MHLDTFTRRVCSPSTSHCRGFPHTVPGLGGLEITVAHITEVSAGRRMLMNTLYLGNADHGPLSLITVIQKGKPNKVAAIDVVLAHLLMGAIKDLHSAYDGISFVNTYMS